jgi:uncharacterized protein
MTANVGAQRYLRRMLWINTAPFRHPLVADLAWAMASPPLLLPAALRKASILDEYWNNRQWQLHYRWLCALDHEPASIEEFMTAHPHSLLGRRFETLLQFWFLYSPHFHLLDTGILWHREGNTIGESDFLIQPEDESLPWHLEVACKYYIAKENSSSWHAWWGPNGTDRLDIKMQKLEQQVVGMQTPEAALYLRERGLPTPARKALIKGYFFIPYHLLGRHSSPRHAHPKHGGGWYASISEATRFSDSYPQWLLLPKERWMSPFAAPMTTATPITGIEMVDQCRTYLIERRRSPLVVQVAENNGWWTEVSRGFIVPD